MGYADLDQGARNADIEKGLDELPDLVAEAQEMWRIATLDREREEALLHMQIKGRAESEGIKKTTDDIKAAVRASEARYQAVLKEIEAEKRYTALNEKLLAVKKRASMRAAF